MGPILLKIAIRLALCLAVLAALWPTWGPFAILIPFAPLVGIALARPIQDLVEEGNLLGKQLALASVQGKYWAHKGVRIDIAEDEERKRWLLASDVRKVLDGLPRDEVLRKQFGDRTGEVEEFEGFRIRADALADYLLKSTDAASLRFRVWLDREVMGGAKANPRSARPTAQ